ncbi:MAG: sugar ABC transporter ATP-binding protein [Chloroflexota bacterium]|nr:sugar ABC transporter ATP-binding protein [Chloroflexota bacterium]
MTEEILRVENISKNFAGVQALKDVSFSISRGEIRCLIGENGSGKSTLIKIIAGVYQPSKGEVAFHDELQSNIKPRDAIDAGIQVIYQDFSLFPNLIAAENIALNYQLSRNKKFINWREVHKIAQEAIERIDVELDLDAIVSEMSVADKQLIAISRALLQNAQLIIMDEPTTALTSREVKALFHVIRNLQEKGISILFVSHKLSEVQEIADNIMILRNGMKVADGASEEFTLAKLAYFMTGREITESNYEYEPAGSHDKSLLNVESLTFPGKFSKITFDLKQGEILGIAGLLGSGRTDLALALFGINPAGSGEIKIDGKSVRIRNIQDAMNLKIGYVPEDRLTEGLFLSQSIGRNTTVRILDKTIGRLGLISPQKFKDQVDEWIKRLSILTNDSGLPVTSLSGGNQQRVVLAKWLASNPKILILNGPTVGVDIGSKMELHELIKELARQGLGMLILSDDLPELMQTCNRILLMRSGQIVEEFTTKDISEQELNQKVTESIA